MTVVKMYCDHCGKEVCESVDYISCYIEINHIELEVDLCCDCFNQLAEKVKDFCSYGEGRADEI